MPKCWDACAIDGLLLGTDAPWTAGPTQPTRASTLVGMNIGIVPALDDHVQCLGTTDRYLRSWLVGSLA